MNTDSSAAAEATPEAARTIGDSADSRKDAAEHEGFRRGDIHGRRKQMALMEDKNRLMDDLADVMRAAEARETKKSSMWMRGGQ